MTNSVFRFGSCELHIGLRELRVAGQPRALEPLAFDLLAYLLRHRDRAVSKDELLDHVWLGRIVSVGSLARAVMTVRQAIGDDGAAPLIRTVHRIGYRFVGAVSESPSEPPVAPPPVARAPIGIALLPFENLTGELSLDWTVLGLMALVGNALATDARLAPLSVHGVSAALRGLPAAADAAQRAQALCRHGGVQEVVHTRILPGERGYRLDYRLLIAPCGSAGSVRGRDPIQLGKALARRLLVHLLAGRPGAPDGFAPHDPWAMQIFARAMQASAEAQWARAGHLLRVVLDLEPDYREARLELQRVEALQGLTLGAPAAA